MANGMRVEALALQRRLLRCCFCHILTQDEADTEPSQPGAMIINKHRGRWTWHRVLSLQ